MRVQQEANRLWTALRGPARVVDRGASLVEYAFLIALIAVVCMAAVTFFGQETSQSFSETGRSISAS